MIQIAIPLAGRSTFYASAEHQYPKPLLDMLGEPMIQRVVASIMKSQAVKRFLFVVNQGDTQKYHVDRVLRLIAGDSSGIVEQSGDSAGALASCLLLVDHLDLNKPLLIANSDQIVDIDYDDMLRQFTKANADGGAVTFPSVHPQWSYVALDERNQIAEAAEKKPISNHAIAGLYYYAKAGDFLSSGMRAIEKGAALNERYYISATFNEMILEGKRLIAYPINKSQYHSFYSPEMLNKYIDSLSK